MNKTGYVLLIIIWATLIVVNAVNYFSNYIDKGWVFTMGAVGGIGLMFAIHLLLNSRYKNR